MFFLNNSERVSPKSLGGYLRNRQSVQTIIQKKIFSWRLMKSVSKVVKKMHVTRISYFATYTHPLTQDCRQTKERSYHLPFVFKFHKQPLLSNIKLENLIQSRTVTIYDTIIRRNRKQPSSHMNTHIIPL